jgi:hypothetical protein
MIGDRLTRRRLAAALDEILVEHREATGDELAAAIIDRWAGKRIPSMNRWLRAQDLRRRARAALATGPTTGNRHATAALLGCSARTVRRAQKGL